MKTVLVADHNRRLGELIAQLLDDDHAFDVVGVARDAGTAVQLAAAKAPDVVLVSEHLDGEDGLSLCAALRRAAPKTALLLWTADVTAETPERLGADGLVERGMSYRELARAVHKVVHRPVASVDLREAREIALPRW